MSFFGPKFCMLETILCNRYQIVRQLGSGGFGDTYLAQDNHLPGNSLCVVKHLKPKNPNPEIYREATRLFNQEAEILHNLGEHPQIPRLLAHFPEGDQFFLVQKFIDGHTLTEELRQPLTEEQTIKLLKEILEVLSFVHQKNIIHRDLKPANIMRRNTDGKIVLIDFGAVKQLSADLFSSNGQSDLTISIGTQGYMPYEQMKGRPGLASDVYAVGIIAIEALTGRLVKELPDNQEGKILWRQETLGVSDKFAEIINKMIEIDVANRYQNADQALAILNKYFPNQDYKIQLIVCSAIFLIVIGSVLAWFRWSSKPESPPILPTPTTNISPTNNEITGIVTGYEDLGEKIKIIILSSQQNIYQITLKRSVLNQVPNSPLLVDLKGRKITLKNLEPSAKNLEIEDPNFLKFN